MRVLVTRPARGAEATARALRRRGHDAILLPLTEPHSLPVSWPESRPAALIATSAEAFVALGGNAVAADIPSLPVYCVGRATAAAAADAGFKDCRIGPGDAAGLAAMIMQDRHGGGAPLLYLAGTPRLPTLETILKAADVPLEVVEVYRMQPVLPGDLAGRLADLQPKAVLFYSREAVRLFFEALSEPPAIPCDIFCLSPAIAAAVPKEMGRLHVALRPEEGALLDLLDAHAAS